MYRKRFVFENPEFPFKGPSVNEHIKEFSYCYAYLIIFY